LNLLKAKLKTKPVNV